MTPPAATPSPAARAAGYALFVGLSVALLVAGLRLDRADFTAPFVYRADALFYLSVVKAIPERGGHWRNERLGAPGIQELHDFPPADHLHYAALWAIGQAWPDPFAAYNLYYLLTYPLTVLTGMAVLRHFGLSVPAAGCAATLYAFQPYHYLRAELGHCFLAAYFVVPLTLAVALWVCRGRLPFFRPRGDGGYRLAVGNADTLAAGAVAVLTASAGV